MSKLQEYLRYLERQIDAERENLHLSQTNRVLSAYENAKIQLLVLFPELKKEPYKSR